MPYRIVADENVEHRLVDALAELGHNVEHVARIARLGKGVDDHRIAQYSLDTDRLILTYDDDFKLDFGPDEYRGVLFVPDNTLRYGTVADIVDEIAASIPHEEFAGLVHVTPDWL
jgi:hypothetical protein